MSDRKDSNRQKSNLKRRVDLYQMRNKQIYKEYLETFTNPAKKMTVQELADKYGMSKNNIYWIIRQLRNQGIDK